MSFPFTKCPRVPQDSQSKPSRDPPASVTSSTRAPHRGQTRDSEESTGISDTFVTNGNYVHSHKSYAESPKSGISIPLKQAEKWYCQDCKQPILVNQIQDLLDHMKVCPANAPQRIVGLPLDSIRLEVQV